MTPQTSWNGRKTSKPISRCESDIPSPQYRNVDVSCTYVNVEYSYVYVGTEYVELNERTKTIHLNEIQLIYKLFCSHQSI